MIGVDTSARMLESDKPSALDITQMDFRMDEKSDHTKTYAIVGELVMMANAIDHLLNLVLIEAFSLEKSPMLEPVIATLDPRQKIEMLKSRAKHINHDGFKKMIKALCDKAESVFRQRNIVCHTPASLVGNTWTFRPVAAVKLLDKLDLEKKTSRDFPLNDIKTAISTGEAALGTGVTLLANFQNMNAERVKRDALKKQMSPRTT